MTEFATQQLGDVALIAAEGRLDALVSPRLEETLKQTLEGGHSRLVVDLAGVIYVSSSSLRVLLLGARWSRERGGDLKICCLSPRVLQVFALAGFDQVFDIKETREQALAAFAVSPGGPGQPCSSA